MAMNTETDSTPLVDDNNNNKSPYAFSKHKTYWILIITVIVILVICLILYFVLREEEESTRPETRNEYFEKQFLTIPSNDSCSNLSYVLGSEPHVAIDQRTYELATILTTIFTELGYDVIRDNISNMVFDHYISSSLTLTLPNTTNINIDLSNSYIPGDQETNTTLRSRAWQPFSASGNIIAPLLYVGSATNQQLDYLQFNLSLNLSNYIALVTNGGRAGRAENIGRRNMKGMIQFESNWNDPETVYPNGPYRPNTGFMYGRIRGNTGCPGNVNPSRLIDKCGYNISNYDDLFPSIKYNVPSIIISAENGMNIFQLFSDLNNETINDGLCNVLPDNWHPGNLPIDRVCIGGNIIANLNVENQIEYNDTIQNVYGYFEGDTYPDEIVMIGAHRDAWGLGAADDISGTVTMMEIARALSVLRDDYNWSSRRSLMFGSWDGEEWGLYGSVEFNEGNKNREFVDKIVTYINFDMTVTGENMVFLSNPLFRELLFDSSKELYYPYNNDEFSTTMSLYDVWNELNPSGNLRLVTTGSDYGAFEYYSGIPTLGVRFDTYPNSFPDVYHTFYDLNGILDLYMDPQWKYAQRIASLGGLLMLKIAQAQILPWDVLRFADKMSEWVDDLINRANSVDDCSIDEYVDDLKDAVVDFKNSADLFDKKVKAYVRNNNYDEDNMDPNEVEKYNNILREMMRGLTLKYPQGMPSNRWYKQIIIDPGSKRFPYIWDTITVGCSAQDLQTAFMLTSNMIYNVSQLLHSIEDVTV
eukprot:124393_1